ncbi:MAG: extracellular solute-binding protein [Defluviitaleaceae bacterium]|nr:extracellular solute-binding protein [Defluviitaleaceae bacterium]
MYAIVKIRKVLMVAALLIIASAMRLTAETFVQSGDRVSFDITVPAAGEYEIWLTYRNNPGRMLAPTLSMTVNGEVPMPQLRRLHFPSRWLALEPNTDRYGNEVPAIPRACQDLQTRPLEDSTQLMSAPLRFNLTRSEYVLEFTVTDGEITIYDIELRRPRVIPPYTPGNAAGNFIYTVEGEGFVSANSPSIRAAGEYSPVLNPYDASRRLLNILDGGSFSGAGDRVDYQVTVPADGWYHIGFRYRQTAKTDFPVFIDILINGEIPTQAAMSVPFDWTGNRFRDMTAQTPDGNDQTFYLTAGVNTVSLVIRAEPIAFVYEEIHDILREMTEFRTELTRLTGGVTTDRHRDFRLDEFMPDVGGTLTDWARRSRAALDLTTQISGGRVSSTFAGLQVAESNLLSLAERPVDVPRRINELSGAPYSISRFLAQALQDMDNNAVSIDRIFVFQSEAELPETTGLFRRFWEAVRRFFLSFTRREFEAGRNHEEEVLQVWMSRPRPFVELLQNMADAEFTPATGIRVDISIMPDVGRYALAAAAGNAPDVGLSVPYVVPSYLNIRGALADLKQFDRFYDIAERFPPGLFVPSIVEGGVFALPETINFWVMYYRSDIFEQLQIPVPDHLGEVLMILPELQRRAMNFFYPTAGMIGLKVFPGTIPFILQNGGAFFGETIGASYLDTPESLAGFQILTDLFTVYNLPIEVPAPGFYQAFRAGTMPIGVSDLGTYLLLTNAAPELEGHWNIAPFPGLLQEDGTVNRHTTGGDTSAIIFSQSRQQENAWKFLDWWTSDQVQADFSVSLVSLYGGTFMWSSANRAAFAQLPIPGNHRDVILQQTEHMVEVPWVPGTYMVERELSNAYNAVIVNGLNVRRAMDIAIKRIDREVFRKLEEFGFTQNGEQVRPFVTPHVNVLQRP